METTKQDILKAFYPTFVGVLIGLVLGGLLWIVARSPRGNSVALLPPPTPAPLVVDVAGAVPRPGVYELPGGSRVNDAIEAAGGFLAEADKSTINLAAPLEDGQRLEIPFLAGVESVGATRVEEVALELIDINTADVDTLITLPGIGPTLAQRIIDYRETYGDFYYIEDIMNVPGIGFDTFENIMDLIMTGYE
ncbi:MAG: ComEA family DNA-binding protein [Anaerolineaceae bacterium]|nr:MAG: ComEA family DNA-binding protein [Anaerolineaceae bacterium]